MNKRSSVLPRRTESATRDIRRLQVAPDWLQDATNSTGLPIVKFAAIERRNEHLLRPLSLVRVSFSLSLVL